MEYFAGIKLTTPSQHMHNSLIYNATIMGIPEKNV